MKKLLIIIILATIFGALYMYRDRFVSRSTTTSQCPTANQIWDSEFERCVPVEDHTDSVDEGRLPTFAIEKVNRITLTINDGYIKKTVEATREGTGKKLSGQFQTEDSPTDGSIVVLTEHTVYQKSMSDVLMPYVVNYGGSGSFVSVGIFTRKNDTTLVLQDSYLLGDRVLIDNLVLEGSDTPYTLHVHFRDRKAGEAMVATPTVPKEAIVTILDHTFAGKI